MVNSHQFGKRSRKCVRERGESITATHKRNPANLFQLWPDVTDYGADLELLEIVLIQWEV
ncbi:hypothetical protein EAE92_20390 [Photorhabdus hainanensis]|nr:hypothetical protein [Photorhabdus hainanensis]